ncbi:hypothetical protein CTKA_00619 [Chthonomonas calidirosea]|uniref:Organic solvent tolerance protein OstA n=1 Tax=Chthonomonas calidirosea (strain DSM 23976 / ICMP 18418 / T49) TaxID=1303518 RepID=S0ESW9_CHTCT|nr:hypothetical protein [Chthonomonas calidirosea]CCW34369.1 hypothetical protein CCALI_00536 [Chthonomonas calidirosea T49]CEK14972.1 hypothetical protein CTKA_00619 [Chthonomonas calidirosea]
MKRFRRAWWSLSLALLPNLLAVRAAASEAVESSSEKQQTSVQTNGTLVVSGAKLLRQNLTNGSLEAPEGATVVYTAPDGTQTTLKAGSFFYDGMTAIAEARGPITLQRAEGMFTGAKLTYNFRDRRGTLEQARLETDLFRASGSRIELLPDGRDTLYDAQFTTCTLVHPDYLIRARRIQLVPGQYVQADGITFQVGHTVLPSFPSYRYSLGTGGGSPTLLPGYDRTDGPYVSISQSLLGGLHSSLDVNARVGVKTLPVGTVDYVLALQSVTRSFSARSVLGDVADPLQGTLERLAPAIYSRDPHEITFQPRSSFFYAMLQNRQFVYNRNFNNISISRFPEVGVRFVNMFGSHEPPAGQAFSLEAPLQVDVAAYGAEINELPTHVTAARFGLRTDLISPAIVIGRRIDLRFAFTNWVSFYSTGTAYAILSPEAGLDYLPTRTSRLNVSLRHLADLGRTPFLFDRRDVRNELRLQYQVGGTWAFGLMSHIDLDHNRAYDNELAIIRNFDCMQVGVYYRTRSQQFGILFNLLPAPRRAVGKQTLVAPQPDGVGD